MIENLFSVQSLCAPAGCTRYTDTEPSSYTLFLTKEHTLTLCANGQALHHFVCSPAQLTELCLGWLFSEGYINSITDVESLRISEDGHIADAALPDLRRRETTAFPACAVPKTALCERAANALLKGETTYTRTRGTHGCVYAARDGELVFCEDIGRYNAVDKTIGAILLRGDSLGAGLLFSSGRIFAGMVEKTVRAGIPVLVSKATATEEAVLAAKRYRQTLLFFADGISFTQANII